MYTGPLPFTANSAHDQRNGSRKPFAVLLNSFKWATYTKIASIAEILRLCFFSDKTFYNIQDMYLFPVISEVWEREQNAIFAALEVLGMIAQGIVKSAAPTL